MICLNNKKAKEKHMIGIVLVTHGNLALEMVATAEYIVGPQKNISSVCFFPEDDMSKKTGRTDGEG